MKLNFASRAYQTQDLKICNGNANFFSFPFQQYFSHTEPSSRDMEKRQDRQEETIIHVISEW